MGVGGGGPVANHIILISKANVMSVVLGLPGVHRPY